MRIGDLVHAPRYPFWGMGMVLEIGSPQDGLLVYWFNNTEIAWINKTGMEKL